MTKNKNDQRISNTDQNNLNEQDLLNARYAAGRIAARCLQIAKNHVTPGITTGEIDKICENFILSQNASAECIGYQGYQHATCISINDVVCHGIPGDRVIQEGDMVNVDLVVRYNGHLADTSTTIIVGNASQDLIDLTKTAENAMYAGMSAVKSGMRVCDIGNAIQRYIDNINNQYIIPKYSLVHDLCSHGIGKKMHEEPLIHNCKNDNQNLIRDLQCFTVEPIVKLGKKTIIYTEPDQWTMRTKDCLPATQFEHTMCIDSHGKLRIFTAIDNAEEQEILSILQEFRNKLA